MTLKQVSFDGNTVESKVPISKLQPAELQIWNFLRTANRGLTHTQIKEKLKAAGSKTQIFDNKLRSLYKKGYVTKHPGPDGILLWYHTTPEDST